MPHEYLTITGKSLSLRDLTARERQFLAEVNDKYSEHAEWNEFASWWVNRINEYELGLTTAAYTICNDLEARLGIAQGKAAPPDYRRYLLDMIEEKWGTRFRFCRETGFDPGQLSRILAGKANFSLKALQKITGLLNARLVIIPDEEMKKRIGPTQAKQVLSSLSPGSFLSNS